VKSQKKAPALEWEMQVDTSVKTEGFGEIILHFAIMLGKGSFGSFIIIRVILQQVQSVRGFVLPCTHLGRLLPQKKDLDTNGTKLDGTYLASHSFSLDYPNASGRHGTSTILHKFHQ